MMDTAAESTSHKHPLDIIAERLECDCISNLRQPEYRERAIQELRKGDFERIDVGQLWDTLRYLQGF